MNAVLRPATETGTGAAVGGFIESVIPTTESQREVWLGAMLGAEASLAYNESVLLRLRGPLDRRALGRAVARLLERHQSLRSTIAPDGSVMLVGQPDPQPMALHDLSTVLADARTQALEAARSDAVSTPFSLENGPLFRATLFTLDEAEHELLMSAHHVVCDGWSWAVITEELGQLYAEQTGNGLAPRPAPSFAEFSAEEAAEAMGADMQAHVDYWLGRFPGGNTPVLDLPVDRARPAVRTFASKRTERVLDRKLVAAMRSTSARTGASLFTGLFSGFVATLHRLTGQDDIVVGIPASGQLARDMPALVGHCVNLLPLRVTAHAQLRFDALMGECSTAVLDAFEHQTLTYGALLGKLAVPRDASRLPLVSVMFNVDPDVAAGAQSFAGIEVTQDTVPRQFENFELFLNLRPHDGGLVAEAQYNTDLFDEASVQRWLDMFECVLRSAAQAPDQAIGRLEVLSHEQAQALLALQPAPTAPEGASLAHAGFVLRTVLQPDSPAIRDGVNAMSYAALDAQSNRMARALRSRGVASGQCVGLCLARGIDMVVALLGVLKAGGCYVPLDPAFPQARLDHYASDAHLGLLITTSGIATAPRAWRADAAERLFEIDTDTAWLSESSDPLPPGALDATADDLAYIIYTSGSTGLPKGVCVPHGGVANLLQSMQAEPGIGPDDRLAAVTTLSFDIAVAELLLPLAAGAEIVMVQRDTAMDGNQLRTLLEEEDITILQATPGMWQLLIDAQWPGAAGFRGWIGGEPVRGKLATELLDRCAQLWNVYGPTETTVWSTVWNMDRAVVNTRGVSIGKPIANTEVWILDADLQPCPIGVPGEICIGGAGVTQGYHERDELTAERFVTARVLGHNRAIYRTGDRGRWRNDGLLDHMGRLDFQVKVRGYRIEPGEIEARCNEVAGVSRSVVVAREDRPGDVRLVAYVAMAPGATLDHDLLKQHLRQTLPEFMLPQHVVTIPSLPTLPNGKIDRVALPAPVTAPREVVSRSVAPKNDFERRVLAAMEQVLSLPGLDLKDDFFTMGGHSLLAARLATLLSREFQITLPLRALFEAPTAERLATVVEALQRAGVGLAAPLPCRPERATAPLTPSQERIRFMEELHPERSVYNAPSAQRLTGALDIARFSAVLNEIIRRQPALRTCMSVDAAGKPVQSIAHAVEFTLPVIDLRHLPADQREDELAERMQELADRPIDITRAPMMHAAIYQVDEGDHAFVFVPHHLVWDGWSFDVMQRELAALYAAAEKGEPLAQALPPIATTHGDYAEWLHQWMSEPEYAQQLGFWHERIGKAPQPKQPRTDMPRRAGRSGQGGTQWIHIDKATTAKLREAARLMDVTLSMLSFGLYALTMSRVVGTDAIVIANPVRGRQVPETEDVMGVFNNLLPVALTVDLTLTLPAFMRYVKQELLTIMNYQQVPYERLMAESSVGGPARGANSYQSMFSFQDCRGRPPGVGSLHSRQMHLMQRGATDDIGVWLMDKPNGLEGALIYNADIYLRETGAHLRDRYLELLDRAVEAPGALLSSMAGEEGSASAAYLRKLAAGDTAAAAAPASAAVKTAKADDKLLRPEHARMAQVWAGVIGIDVNDIRGSDNFFDLGGDSLLVLRAVQQCEQTLGLRIEPRRFLFENLGQIAVTPRTVPSIPPIATTAPAAPKMPAKSEGLLGRAFGGWLRKG